VARSRVLGAVAVGWLLTVPALALSLLVLAHPRLAFLRGNAVFLLVVGLIMVGVTELMRRANQLAIGTLLAAVVLSQVRAWRTLRGSTLGWDTIVVAIIIGVLANGLWGAFQLAAVRQEAALSSLAVFFLRPLGAVRRARTVSPTALQASASARRVFV
jgi:hypothetical protein